MSIESIMDTLNVMNVGERLAKLAFIGPEARAQKKKRDDDESREIRQRISCPDGQFEKIPTKFNETLLNRQEQENRCEKNSSNRSYCCDFETCPDGYIEVSNKGKSNLERNLLEKYCYGREKDNDGDLSYCCNKFPDKLWDPNDKAFDILSQDEIDPENPRSFVTLYPCKQRLGYDESTRKQLINHFFFKPEEFENEYPPENRDKCIASNTKIDFIYRGDYHNDEPYGDDFEVWYDSNIDLDIIASYLTKCSEGTINRMITKKIFAGNDENGEPTFKNEFKGRKITYKGGIKNGKPHGRGKVIFPEGGVVEGEFKNGKVNGQGKMIYSDGEVYEGEFKDGQQHGQGKMIYDNGDVYEGEFFLNEKHGQGKMIYDNGDVYEGEFYYGERQGQGKIIYANGEVYEGEWYDDDPNLDLDSDSDLDLDSDSDSDSDPHY